MRHPISIIVYLILLTSCKNGYLHFGTLERHNDGFLYDKFNPKTPFTGYCYDAMGNLQADVKNGVVNGVVKMYYPDSKAVLFEYYYQNDTLNGPMKCYCENGKLIYSVDYIKGKRNGDSLYFSCKDKWVSKTHFINDKMTGEFVEYYFKENVIKTNGYYFNNSPCGIWVSYDTLGNQSNIIYNSCPDSLYQK